MITADRLSREISALGVAPGDVVMVHVSLRAIGPLENGAAGLLEALRISVGHQGTLLMVLGANIPHDWVNKRPESVRETLLAEKLLRDAPWHDYYGPGSPLQKLCEAGGKILRIGANPDTTTVLHYAEYLADVPNKRRVRRHYRCKSVGGSAIRAVECLNDEDSIVSVDGEDYFARILRDYLALGRGRRGQVGDAAAELIEAADIANFGAQWMTRNLSQP